MEDLSAFLDMELAAVEGAHSGIQTRNTALISHMADLLALISTKGARALSQVSMFIFATIRTRWIYKVIHQADI